jgi:hypothetical protein
MLFEHSISNERCVEGAQKDHGMCPACNEVEIESPGIGFELACEQKCAICVVCFSKAASAALSNPMTIKCLLCKLNCCCWMVNYTHVSQLSGGEVHQVQRKYTTNPSECQEID